MRSRKAPRGEMEDCARSFYARVRDGMVEALRETHPDLFDDEGRFDSWVTTNPVEGPTDGSTTSCGCPTGTGRPSSGPS